MIRDTPGTPEVSPEDVLDLGITKRTAWYRLPAPASERDAEVIAALTEIVDKRRRWASA